jgi:translocation and assembly module TamB
LFLGALAAVLVLLALFLPASADEADKGVLANLISNALSSSTRSVSIGAVEGVLSSNATIRNIVIADRDGPWLKVDEATLVWSRLALLSRRLQVDKLTIKHMQVLRRPVANETPPAAEPGAPQAILPDLPVKVVVKDFAVQELSLGEPVVGVAARLAIAGRATLGPPAEGLDLALASRRLDAPGEFKALMTYVPATDKLTVSVDSSEPAGGLFVHLANIPGLPPATFNLKGAGPLDNFDAKLDFNAGPDAFAKGDVTVARQGPARRLALDLAGRLEGMSPDIVRPVAAGETTLKGDVLFEADGAVKIPGLHLVSANARLDVEGARSVDDRLDLKIHAGAIPGSTAIGKLDLNATVNGPASAPAIDASLEAGDVKSPQGSLDRFVANLRARSSGSLTETASRILFDGDGTVTGLALADPAIARALGRDFKLAMRGALEPGGQATFDALDLVGSDFEAHYAGLLGAKRMHGHLDLVARNLSRFGPLAGGKLAGEARVGADLDGAPGYGVVNATLDGRATSLATPHPLLDRVIGGELAVAGAARVGPGRGFGFSDLRATGRNGAARLNGEVRSGNADLTATLDIPQAKEVDPRVDGKIGVEARLTGSLEDLGAELEASLGPGRLFDRKTTGVKFAAKAQHLMGLANADATLTGDAGGQPLHGGAHVARRDDGGWGIDNLGLDLGSARLAGAGTLDKDGLADGDLSFSAKNLDDLSPLVLTKLGGSIEAKIRASSAGGKQSATVAATSERMSVADTRVEGLKVDMSVADAWGARGIEGTAAIARGEVGGEALSGVKLTASAGADYSDLDFAGTLRGLAVKARGRLFGGSLARLDLASLTAQGGKRRIALSSPTTLTFGGDGVTFQHFALAVDAGRLALDGTVGDRLDLRAGATDLPLAALDLMSPGLQLSGVADGEATIAGTRDSPTGDWRIRLKQVAAPQTRGAGLPPMDVAGSGRLGGGRTSVDLAVNAGAANALKVTGYAPLSADGALDLSASGKIDARLANATLSASGQNVTGALTVAWQARGTIARPNLTGTVTVANGAFADDRTGFRLTGVNAAIAANGDQIRIERLSGTTPNGGSLTASGQVRLDPAAGFPGAIHIVGTRAQIVANDVVTATANLGLDLTGALAQTPTVSGRVDVLSMDVTIPNRFGSLSSPIPGTKHVRPTPTARAVLAQIARARAARAGRAFDAKLALDVSAPNRVFLRGRGVNAEFGGDIRVSGTSRAPQATGGFDLLRGTLALVGRPLTFTRGRVTFRGDVIPDLDLVAETTAADVTARVEVAGPANQPTFAITSSPSLPEDEILARILFQNSTGNLSAFQALELANAAATLSGGADMLDPLRKSLGLSSLGVGSGGGGGLLGLGRVVNDRISVDVRTGMTTQQNGVDVNLDLTRHIRLQAGVDASGGTDVGVGAGWESK